MPKPPNMTKREERSRFIPGYSVSTRLPAVRGAFGYTTYTYSTSIRADQLVKILGHDPRSDAALRRRLPDELRKLYEIIQRPTQRGRRVGVARYAFDRISKNRVGGFPSLSIGLSKTPDFEAFDPNDESFGWLILDDDQVMVILDGLGRATGLLDLYESGEDGKEVVRKIVIPVTFFAPGEDYGGKFELKRDGQQLFVDFNLKVNKVPVRLAISKDEYDPYIQLANVLAESDFIANHGGMATGVATISKTSKNLVTQQTLNRVVRGAIEGRAFQESNVSNLDDPKLTEKTQELFLETLTYFFSEIANRMGSDLWTESDSLHLSSPGWQALALLFHDLFVTLNPELNGGYDPQISTSDYDQIFTKIAGINWSRDNKDLWVDELQIGVWHDPDAAELATNPKALPSVKIHGAGRTTTERIHNYLQEITGVKALLETMKSA